MTKKKNINILILCPWDFCESLNWRLGLNNNYNYFEDVKNEIDYFFNLVKSKKNIKIFYFDAPTPKSFINCNENNKIKNYINLKVAKLNCLIFPEYYFDITKYFEIGFPFKTKHISKIAKSIFNINFLTRFKKIILKKNKIKKQNIEENSKKILITDFDEVLWKGVIAEDGYKKINCGNNIGGYKHFLYQSFIKKLINRGVILIGVTRNRLEVAKRGFSNKESILSIKDFIKIYATYQHKSEMIKKACALLNLSTDSAVFVDDNLIEIFEVKKNLPKVKTLIFPKSELQLPKFIEKLNNLFQKNFILKEDRLRLENYRLKKVSNSKINFKSNFDLSDFLGKLKMKLQVYKIDLKNKNLLIRPFQLINKTNQFNLNGIRLTKIKFYNILKNGGKIFSGTYTDRTGDYGEIISLLLDKNSNVVSFIMSCRVFQRNIEYAFLYCLVKNNVLIKKFNYKKTNNNLPMQDFFTKDLKKYLFKSEMLFNKNQYLNDFKNQMSNFEIKFKVN